MELIVRDEEEAVLFSQYLSSICNAIKMSNIPDIQATGIENFLCRIRNSVVTALNEKRERADQILEEEK